MGAILGIAGVAVLVVLITILWMTGAFSPRPKHGPGPGFIQPAPAEKRVGNLD